MKLLLLVTTKTPKFCPSMYRILNINLIRNFFFWSSFLCNIKKKFFLQKGQLRRQAPNAASDESRREKRKTDRDKDSNWNALPGLIPNIGTKYGRRATWIGASGDQTFIKIDESLINSHNLSKSSVVCSKTCIGNILDNLK